MMTLDSFGTWLMNVMAKNPVSDIYLREGEPVRARLHDKVQPLTPDIVPATDIHQIAASLLTQRREAPRLESVTDLDFGWDIPGRTLRFRVNLHRTRGKVGLVFRVIPSTIPTLQANGVPAAFAKLLDAGGGLVLVCGKTGSGKTTTQAAAAQHIVTHRAAHIVTVEDPVEYLIPNHQGLVTQREVGIDTLRFATGLRAALRESPDVIIIGEMRDPETIEIALIAAETGHLVIPTVHRTSFSHMIRRIEGAFPQSTAGAIRARLADVLRGTISQKLVKRAGPVARMALACELVTVTDQLRDVIRSGESSEDVNSMIASHQRMYGSLTLEQHLAQLVRGGVIEEATALAAAHRPRDLRVALADRHP